MKLTLKLVTIISANHLNTKRKLFYNVIVKIYGISLRLLFDRQAGIAAAKIQLSLPQTASHEDNLAPHELTDEAELAQAKFWQTLPKHKRAIMQTETIQAGLAAASNK